MMIFINELSAHAQFEIEGEFETALAKLSTLLLKISETNVEKDSYLDSRIYAQLIAHERPFTAGMATVRDKSVRVLFKRVIHELLGAREWQPERQHEQCPYDWLGANICEWSPAELAERVRRGGVGFLTSLFPSRFDGAWPVQVRKANQLIEIYSLVDVREFERWCRLHPELGLVPYSLDSPGPPEDEQTSLVRRGRFLRTARRNQGRTLYRERSSGRLFCVDNMHSGGAAHLEVFSSGGDHVGEASLDGVVDVSKRDAAKRLD
jgi:hypothetical protein